MRRCKVYSPSAASPKSAGSKISIPAIPRSSTSSLYSELRNGVAVQENAELRRRELQPRPKRPELGVTCADLVETHFVDELLEHDGIVGVEIDAPLVIVEPDRAGNYLDDLAMIGASDDSMLAHHLRAGVEAEQIPVLHFAAAFVHRIEARV